MPLQFANIVNAEARASCAVPGVGEKLNFTYRPNILTPNLLAEFDAAKTAENATQGFIEQFVRFISWWDIEVPGQGPDGQPALDGAGQPRMVNLPITKETVGDMGFFLLSAIMAAAIEDAKPGEAPSAS